MLVSDARHQHHPEGAGTARRHVAYEEVERSDQAVGRQHQHEHAEQRLREGRVQVDGLDAARLGDDGERERGEEHGELLGGEVGRAALRRQVRA